METWLWNKVNPEIAFQVILILSLAGLAVWLRWPEIKKRISEGPLKDKRMQDADASLDGKIRILTDEVRELNRKMLSVEEKLATDFARINSLERETDQMRKLAESSMEERQILMECSLAMLKGIRELGAKEWGNDGPPSIKKAEDDLQNYLTSKAHRIG